MPLETIKEGIMETTEMKFDIKSSTVDHLRQLYAEMRKPVHEVSVFNFTPNEGPCNCPVHGFVSITGDGFCCECVSVHNESKRKILDIIAGVLDL